MLLIKKVMLLALIVVLFGCGSKSIRQETETSISQKIVEGKTTKNEIESMFGLPTSTSLDTGLDVWKYESSEPILDVSVMNSVNLPDGSTLQVPDVQILGHTKKVLNIIFNKNAVVNKYSLTEDTTKQ